MALREIVIGALTIPIIIIVVIGEMIRLVADKIASIIQGTADLVDSHIGAIMLVFALVFLVGHPIIAIAAGPVSIVSAALMIFGAAVFGAFAVHGLSDNSTEVETQIEEEIIPYKDWPDSCYACPNDIDDELRAQFVVHREESEAGLRAVGLCNECALTYSTVLDNHDILLDAYDKTDDPIDI